MERRSVFNIRILLPVLIAAALIGLAVVFWPKHAAPEPEPEPVEPSAPVSVTAEPEPTPLPVPESFPLRISELMAKNRAVLAAADGSFPDWIELENCGDEPVSLAGWSLNDKGKPGDALPDRVLQPGEFALILAGGTQADLSVGFSLSEGEQLSLFDPNGFLADAVTVPDLKANHALALGSDGKLADTRNATPGYANDPEGYEAFCSAQRPSSPLLINEVTVSSSNFDHRYQSNTPDWVELINVSDEPVSLADYYLSDKPGEPLRWQLPDGVLAPGARKMIYCIGDDYTSVAWQSTVCDFSLNAAEESLFLSDSEGRTADFVYLRGIPVDGSMGRLPGQNGFFYFNTPSPDEENSGGRRRIADSPRSLTADGVYEAGTQLLVSLEAAGEIRYTLDASLPGPDSPLYTEPIPVDRTTIVRAVSFEKDALPSPTLNLSFLIGEDCHLPVISIVTDSHSRFLSNYHSGFKYSKVKSSMSFYEDGGSFTIPCGLSLKGWTSLGLPKKSMGVNFSGFGGGDLYYDLFGNGVTRFSSLSIRAGQDYTSATIRDELFQNLALELGTVPTQSSRWCVLFLDGEYWGIYALKEDFSRRYYAEHAGVSKDQVTVIKSPVVGSNELNRDLFRYAVEHDLSEPEHYAYFCELFDVDNLIDWMILEAYCCNTDINGNLRYFRAEGGKWQIAFYDLDWTFINPDACAINLFNPSRILQLKPVLQALSKNPDFRWKLALRCVELSRGVLSNRHVLDKIDEYQRLLEEEMPREGVRWEHGMNGWLYHMDRLRSFVTDNDMENHLVDRMFCYLKITDEERESLLG